MKILGRLYKTAVILACVFIALILVGNPPEIAQKATVVLGLVAVVFWVLWPVFTAETPARVAARERRRIHRAQQKALKRHSKSMKCAWIWRES